MKNSEFEIGEILYEIPNGDTNDEKDLDCYMHRVFIHNGYKSESGNYGKLIFYKNGIICKSKWLSEPLTTGLVRRATDMEKSAFISLIAEQDTISNMQ